MKKKTLYHQHQNVTRIRRLEKLANLLEAQKNPYAYFILLGRIFNCLQKKEVCSVVYIIGIYIFMYVRRYLCHLLTDFDDSFATVIIFICVLC